MNTPAHLIVGTYFFASTDRRGTYIAALIGAMLPDLSLYVMVAVSIWGLGVSPQVVFDEYYYSEAWQSIFAVDNSFVLWGLLAAVALWKSWPRIFALAGAALLHIALDFPLHTHDARMHFWPISDWVFESPVSYWDSRAYAGLVAPVEFAVCLLCAVLLWRRFQDIWVRGLTAILMLFQTMSTGVWQLFF